MYSKGVVLLFTFGVLERVGNMMRLAGVTEMEEIMSDFAIAYSTIYAMFTSNGKYEYEYEYEYGFTNEHEDCDNNSRRAVTIVGLLRTMRKSAYDIERIIDVSATQTGAGVMWSDALADSIEILRGILWKLVDISDTVDPARTAELRSTFGNHAPTALSLSNIREETAASFRYGCQLWSLREDTVVGLESEKEEIVNWILDNHFDQHPIVISIEGEAGVGKTTLAQMIYNDDDVQLLTGFELVGWALVPGLSALKDTVVEIIKSFTNLRRPYLQRQDMGLLLQILSAVLSRQKYLLVLDDYDVSLDNYTETSVLDELREIFQLGSAGSTIITVTEVRDLVVAAHTLYLDGLPKDECWSLFARSAGFDKEAEKKLPSFVTRIGRSLVGSCRRCPLAIKTLGSILRTNRDELSWKQMKNSKIWSTPAGYEQGTSTATAAFTNSVEHLSGHLLLCLHLSSILSRKNMAVSKDQLLFYWMALGLLDPRDGVDEDPIDMGNRYIIDLELMCFVRLFRSHGLTMVLLHNVVASLDTMLGEDVASAQSSVNYYRQDCPYLVWNGGSISLKEGGLEYLPTTGRSFHFKNYVGPVSKSFLVGLINRLRFASALLLDGLEFEELPTNIGSLHLLRYLSLAGNHTLRELPDSLANLLSLQSVDLSGCERLQTLPRNMKKLVNLRHLFLSLKLTNFPAGAHKNWSSLHHLRICNSPNLNSLPEEVARLTALKILQIHDCNSIASLPSSINRLTSLKEISIVNCNMLDLTNWDGLKGSRGLRFLQIQGLPKLRKFPKGLESAAYSLRHLVVTNCLSLISLPECLHKCTNLVEMVIDNCPRLGALPKGIQQIKTLQMLTIVNCPELMARCQSVIGCDWQLISHIPKVQLLRLPIYHKRGAQGDKGIKLTSGSFTIYLRALAEEEKDKLMTEERKSLDIGLMIMNTLRHIFDPTKDYLEPSNICPTQLQSSGDVEKDPNHHDLENGLQHSTMQTRAAISICSPSTSTNNDHAECHEQNMGRHEAKMVMKNECSNGAASLQDTQDLPATTDQEILTKATVIGEMKDYAFILFLLPEHYEIEKDMLIQLWIALKYIQDEPMELHGEKCFRTVVRDGYLLHCGTNFMTGKDRYRTNSTKINELRIREKDNASYYLQWRKECLPAESIRHVSLGSSGEIDTETFKTLKKFEKLRTLLFLGNPGHRVIQMPSYLFSSLNKLHALDLSRTHLEELPSSIGHMTSLKFLNLSWTLIKWLPDTVCSLAELQTLKLQGCTNLSVLPEQVTRLTKLRHLDVDVLRQLQIMPKGIGELLHLRTFPAFLVGTKDGYKIQELKQLNHLSGKLCIAKLENVLNESEAGGAALYRKEQLEKLELRWTASEILLEAHQNSEAILKCLQPCMSLEELQLLCYEGAHFPDWVGDPKWDKLVRIVFYRCERVLELPPVEQLPHLKHLELLRMNSVKTIELQSETVAFPNLEKMEINEMRSLEVWDWKKRSEGDFNGLTHLIIDNCPMLEEFNVLPHLSSIKCFEIRECVKLQYLSDVKLPNTLEELTVEDCPQIQKRCEEKEGVDWHKINHVPNISIEKVEEDESDE